MGTIFTRTLFWGVNSFAIFLISLIISCGQKSHPDDSLNSNEIFQSGFFKIDFKTINPQISGNLSASGIMWIKKDQLYVKIIMKEAQSNIRYQQYMHSGSDCPSLLNDRNRDGVLDYFENFGISGKVLFPLDRNIKDEISGNDWFPVTSRRGTYIYSTATSISKLVKDLRDRSTGQGAVLGPGEQLNPDSRVIILYGSLNDPLLPVACGLIKKNHNLPTD